MIDTMAMLVGGTIGLVGGVILLFIVFDFVVIQRRIAVGIVVALIGFIVIIFACCVAGLLLTSYFGQ